MPLPFVNRCCTFEGPGDFYPVCTYTGRAYIQLAADLATDGDFSRASVSVKLAVIPNAVHQIHQTAELVISGTKYVIIVIAGEIKMNDDTYLVEYYKLVDIVGSFDARLLTVKSWGVTLSLAALGLGFQFSTAGYFLVSAFSALAFWLIEAAMKGHQMQHYPRMREIEVLRASPHLSGSPSSSPQIDWCWTQARYLLKGASSHKFFLPPERRGTNPYYINRFILPTVMLPHLITIILGLLLFYLAQIGVVFWK